jgi:hypothetical protein
MLRRPKRSENGVVAPEVEEEMSTLLSAKHAPSKEY